MPRARIDRAYRKGPHSHAAGLASSRLQRSPPQARLSIMSEPPSSDLPPRPPVRLALMGAGTFARTAHLAALRPLVERDLVKVVSVFSRTETAASSLAALYDSYPKFSSAAGEDTCASAAREYLEHEICDAFVLALPPSAQLRAVLEAPPRGVPILLEKPLATCVADARKLLRHHARLAVAENFRFEPAFRAARARVERACGRVLGAHLAAHTPMPPGSTYGRGWRLELTGPGVLLDGVVHLVAGLRVVLASDVEAVSTRCQSLAGWFAGADTVAGELRFASGVSAGVFVTYAAATFLWRLTVVGSDAEVLVERVHGARGYRVSTVRREGNRQVVEAEDMPFGGVDAEFEAFVASCHSENMHPDLDARAAFNDLATVEAMWESSQRTAPVRVATLETSAENRASGARAEDAKR